MRLVGSVLYPETPDEHHALAEFVRQRIPRMERPFDASFALGVVRGGEFAGAIIFHNPRDFQGKLYDLETSIAFDRSDWIRPSTMRHLFSYPFDQLGCVRLTSLIERKNKKARKVCAFFGFKVEGVARKAWNGTEDLMIYGMLRQECRFLKRN